MSENATKISRTQIEKDNRVQRMAENLAKKLGVELGRNKAAADLLIEQRYNAMLDEPDEDGKLAALGALLAARAGYIVLLPPEPRPQATGGPSIWEEVVDDLTEAQRQSDLRDSSMVDLVTVDMKNRDIVGRERYGTPLQAGNGRDALRDAYEEALDYAVYRRQAFDEAVAPQERNYERLHWLATATNEQLTPHTVDAAVRARAYWKAIETILATREEMERCADARRKAP